MKYKLSDTLRRPMRPGSEFISEIDGFRFLAILTVCILHLNNFYGRSLGYDYYQGVNILNSWSFLVNRSGVGVEIFFAISGFVIALPFFRYHLQGGHAPSVKQYLYRRVTRLEPPFLLSCLVLYAAFQLQSGQSLLSDLGHLLAAATYTHELIYGVWVPFNPVTWSLEVEIQFYLLAPFIIRFIFLSKHNAVRLLTMVALAAASILPRWLIYEDLYYLHLHMSILVNLHYFLIGFFLCWLYLERKEFLLKKSLLWDAIGLAGLWAIYYYLWQANQTMFSVALTLLFLGVFKGVALNWFFTRRWIYVIGGMCYSVYLLHYPMFHLVGKFTSRIGPYFDNYYHNLGLQMLIVFPIAFVLCAIFFVFVEKPCMDKNWPQKLYAYYKLKFNK